MYTSDCILAAQKRFVSRQGQEVSLYSTASKPSLESTQALIQRVFEALSWRAGRQGLETDHSPTFLAEIIMDWRLIN
jgi:hypothetical protein